MADVRVNPVGMASTDEGYISSITVRTGGSAVAKTPNSTTGIITVSAAAATQLVQKYDQRMQLVSG
jgi:hypothetical protein